MMVAASSMHSGSFLLENQVFHACIGRFLPWLAEQNHQNYPFNLLDIDVRSFQRQQAIDEDFALRRRQNAYLL
jgi:hypothetical protein